MGLMGLFSKKSNLEGRQPRRLAKSQAYEYSAASLPGAQGAYAVTANGHDAVETWLRPSNFNQSHVSLAESSAPPPAVPRFKDEDEERPGSAPDVNWLLGRNRSSGQHEQEHRQRAHTSAGPPVSLRKSKLDSMLSAPRHASLQARWPEADIQRLPRLPRLSFANQRATSTKSDVAKGFVDILDAHSEIKPHDFRTRVQATGARDYGEDVADRNLGVNGTNLDSSQVQAFYATSSVEPRPKNPKENDPPRARLRRIYDNDKMHHHITKQLSRDAGIRTKMLNSPNRFVFPDKSLEAVAGPAVPPLRASTPANTSRPVTAAGNQSLRRQSLNSLVSAWPSSAFDASRAENRLRVLQIGATPRGRASSISKGMADQFDVDGDTMPPETNSRENTAMGRPRTPRDTVVLVQNKSELVNGLDKMDASPLRKKERPATLSISPAQERLEQGHVYGSPGKRPSTRCSLHAFKPSLSSSIASLETVIDLAPAPHQRVRLPALSASDNHEARRRGSKDMMLFASMGGGHSRENSREDIYGYPRTRSLVSLPASRSRLSEIEEHVPPRTSSIRHWSMSSTTPTTSSASSNTFFPRPGSRHTPSTSVDLSNTLSIRNSSRSSLNSGGAAWSPAKAKSPGFNMDDYLSSDDDSFTAPRRPRGEGEESLLFSDTGYGPGGAQLLPGLEDALAAPAPVVPGRGRGRGMGIGRRSPRGSTSLPPGELRQAFYYQPQSPPATAAAGGTNSFSTFGTFGRASRSSRKNSLDGPATDYYNPVYDDNDDGAGGGAGHPDQRHYLTDGAQDDLLLQQPPQRPSSSAGVGTTRRLSALAPPPPLSPAPTTPTTGGAKAKAKASIGDEVIEEERLEKIDPAEAVRARKEAKARKRAMAAAAAAGGKRKGVLPACANYGDGDGRDDQGRYGHYGYDHNHDRDYNDGAARRGRQMARRGAGGGGVEVSC